MGCTHPYQNLLCLISQDSSQLKMPCRGLQSFALHIKSSICLWIYHVALESDARSFFSSLTSSSLLELGKREILISKFPMSKSWRWSRRRFLHSQRRQKTTDTGTFSQEGVMVNFPGAGRRAKSFWNVTVLCLGLEKPAVAILLKLPGESHHCKMKTLKPFLQESATKCTKVERGEVSVVIGTSKVNSTYFHACTAAVHIQPSGVAKCQHADRIHFMQR